MIYRWWDHAACKGMDTAIFFSKNNGSMNRSASQRAIAICRGCPVSVECLADALAEERSLRSTYGVRGGYSARARIEMKIKSHAATA